MAKVETTNRGVKHDDVQVYLGDLAQNEANSETILTRVERALKASRYDAKAYIDEATDGDYQRLLDVTRSWVRTFELAPEVEATPA